jgi:D-alanyl-D-alanine carboxypeptidase
MRSIVFTLSAALCLSVHAQLPADTAAKVDAAAEKVLKDTGVPSASVAIVKDGKVVYTHAYGLAHLQPDVAATPDIAYPIGSISKQFTATAMLILQQEGKLSVDDSVAKYFPTLTRANDITIRHLLTMTSGYEDYAPQDYTIPIWLKPVDPKAIVMEWATKPLDFEPGTQYQYSNTNFVLAALIVEKVSGEPFAKFLREHVLKPAGLKDVVNTYTEREKLKVTGYVSYAMQPVREQPLEGANWYLGDGDLAMPASTLAAWDIVLMNQSLLKPESYKQFETAMKLKDGSDTGYGLGIDVHQRTFADGSTHRELEHSGEVGGFVSENVLFPEDEMAVVVLTNEVASNAASMIAHQVLPLLNPLAMPKPAQQDAFAAELGKIMTRFQSGQIDRALFTDNCNSYFSADALKDFQATLAPLGTVTGVARTRTALRGGMTFGFYRVTFSGGTTVLVSIYLMPNGKVEQLLVEGKS